jgi:subtilase family serine protease
MRILRFLRTAGTRDGAGARSRRAHRLRPDCETMDDRLLLSADAASAALADIKAETSLDVLSVTSTAPTGYSPEEIRTAYGIDEITFSNGTITGDGAGETIAIVDAYADPDIASDLATFDAEYDLPSPPSFTVDNLGATATDAAWALETALDVEWAHAIAPDANIILVEASSDSLDALFGAVSYASNLPGVGVVSMSWGTSEFSTESNDDTLFTTPSGHTNVTYVAASGDTGAQTGVMYPASSPNVLSVGGTTLTLSSSGTYGSESGWSDSTGGFSLYESEPSYQVSTLESVGLSDGSRTVPDVSLDADPSTGYSVYDSVPYEGESGWFEVGGTSAAAPAWAGLVAITDQGLATVGKGTLSTTELLDELYSLPSSDFNDVTSGSNGYSATAGYDLVTGLGTPKADLLVAGLVADAGSSTSSSSSSGVSTVSTTSNSPSSSSPTSKHSTHKKHAEKKTTHTKDTRTKVKKEKLVKQKTDTVAIRPDALFNVDEAGLTSAD